MHILHRDDEAHGSKNRFFAALCYPQKTLVMYAVVQQFSLNTSTNRSSVCKSISKQALQTKVIILVLRT